MNKQELIERIEELQMQVDDLRGEAFNIADEMDNTNEDLRKIYERLMEADSYIDNAFEELEEALEKAQNLSEYAYPTTYAKMARHISNKILCNIIADIDESLYDTQMHSNGEQPDDNEEVFQWWLTDCTESDVEYLTEEYSGVHFYYSEKLGLWVLGVCHYGTSWDYVYIETNNEYDKIDKEEMQ